MANDLHLPQQRTKARAASVPLTMLLWFGINCGSGNSATDGLTEAPLQTLQIYLQARD